MSSATGSTGPSKPSTERRRALWEAYKNIAIVFSFIVNFVLVIVLLLIVGWLIFPTKTDVVEPMLDDLQGAVNALDSATIVRTIQIDEQVPVNFTLPLEQTTVVVLSQDVQLVRPATFVLPDGGGSINGTVSLSLPTGLALPVMLDLDVPVQNVIPVRFPVQVSIPLRETELSQVVVELNAVLGPLRDFLDDLPDGF
jgi:hypothetical protein